jgi:anti-sigma28 factor (negative regulator of flagellin synthesis)
MMSCERTSTEARGGTGERIPRDSISLSEVVGESNHAQEARPNRHQLVERLRQSIAAGNYLTSEKIDGTVERLYRELLGS